MIALTLSGAVQMVVLAGLVWNAPTSCAWASRVMVNSRAARNHGLKAVGLPSSHVVTRPGLGRTLTVCVRERERACVN